MHGKIVGDTWYKKVRRSIHQLRVPPAWAVDWDDLKEAREKAVRTLVIKDTESGTAFSISIDRALHGKVFNRGYGQQVLLPLQWFRVEPASERPETLAGRLPRLY